jgi:hypothetical protein
MSCGVCHGIDQGRYCPACLNATRAVFGMAPLDDGPQDEPEEGRPVPSVTDVEAWPARVLVAAFVLLVIAAALSPLAFI